jgi:hypothetical protein
MKNINNKIVQNGARGINRSVMVKRSDDLTISPADGLYNQLLFDLCSNDALVALSLFGSYNPVIDRIGVVTSDVHRIVENFVTYVSADGTAAGTPTSGVISNACEPGNSIEAGGCSFVLEGWGRLRRSSPVRDITDIGIRYCDKQPTYDIAGNRIDNDYEWGIIRLMTAILQDLHRLLISGQNTNAGEANGLLDLIDFGYTDPITGEACTAMDSAVWDWGGNSMCLTEEAPDDITYNDVVVTPTDIVQVIKQWLRRTHMRINLSSLSGSAPQVALIPTEALACLIECYVCHTVCNNDIQRMNSFEARARMEELMSQIGDFGTITLSFDGYPIIFYPYDYELINEDDTVNFLIVTPNIGSTPITRVQMKNMSELLSNVPTPDDYQVTDGSRVLSWQTLDHTCVRTNSEIQWRVYLNAPWTATKFLNVGCTPLMGQISSDPQSAFFFEENLVPYPVASNFVQLSVPVANDDMYNVILNTQLIVNAASGVLANDTGEPTPTAVAIVAGATTEGGVVTLATDGSFTYDPPSATFTGIDTFAYTATNSQGTDAGTVTIVVYDDNV